jgi:hypothetical protein
MRPTLTYANVVATLALVIAIGGASAFAASQLGKNTVGPKQIKKNAVTTAKIKNEAVTAAKVKKGTLTGTQINLASLGTVPSAANAANAANAQALDGQSAGQLTSASKLHCPSGMTLSHAVCFQEAASGAMSWAAAADQCFSKQLRLPTLGELLAFEVERFPEFNAPPAEWTEPESYNGAESWAIVAAGSEKGVSYGSTKASESYPFRCVTPASN